MENNKEQLAPQPVPSEPLQGTPPSQKPVLLKWLLIVFLFSLAALGGALYVQNTDKSQQVTLVPTQIPQAFPSPTPPPAGGPTANWKEYNNTYFSLQYPATWTVEDLSNPQIKSEVTYVKLSKLKPEEIEMFIVVKFKNSAPSVSSLSSPNGKKRLVLIDGVTTTEYFETGGIAGSVNKAIIEFTKDNLYYLLFANNYTNDNFEEFDKIVETFKFPRGEDEPMSYASPNGSYLVEETMIADNQIIRVKDNKRNVVVDDIIAKNTENIYRSLESYGVKGRGQVGYAFKEWLNNDVFLLKILPAADGEYQILVDAGTGLVYPSTFTKIN
ncbi:MAG: hypothetical protein HY429_03050 [Candidatus Levybacteria bacterium]|nr:hypothetical protein [Candidatus Levybacteria bacterium]